MTLIQRCRAEIIIFLLIVGITNGCASYKAQTLPILQPDFAPYSKTVDGVTLSVKKFTAHDSKRYFDRDLIAKGFQPIQLTINNDTNKYIMFSAQGINLPTVPAQDVADEAHTSTTGRAAAYGVAGLFIWPLLIPAVVDGVGSSNANAKLDRDFDAKTAQQLVVQPYATHNGVIFIPTSEYNDAFRVILLDKEDRIKYVYDVRGI